MSAPLLRRKLWIPIYDSWVHIGVYEKLEDATADLQRWLGPGIEELSGVAACVRNGQNVFALVFRRSHLDANTLAHEVFHLTARILEHWSVRFDPGNHEAWAALNGYLHQKVYPLLKKWIKK